MKHCFMCLWLFAITCLLHAQTPTPQWRPVYHFTPEKNWTNDPNGLIYINGVYHLYNQQNPYENFWGHMSWGHATSTDLVHWKHLPIAIPEKISGDDTLWRYSGSAVLDKNNTSGWCKNGGCLVAIYTVDEPHKHKESQYVAYSNDNGMSFTDYEKNPVIDLNKRDFRDPNVFWYEPGKFWLMTVVLPAEHKAQFYRSANLKDWSLLSEFGQQGYTGSNWECPFLVQLPVEGKPSEKRWVLVISAAGGSRGVFQQYFIGNFDGSKFTNDNPGDSIFTLDYGDTYYASIPWNNTPGNKKTYMGWMIPNRQPTFPWRGQMSIPRDLGLRQTKDGIRLVQNPSSVISKNLGIHSRRRTITLTNVPVKHEEIIIDQQQKLRDNAYWLKAVLQVEPGATAGFKIAQEKDATGKIIHETVIGYDALTQEVFVDRTNSGGELNKNHLVQKMPAGSFSGDIMLEILVDKSSLEVFVNKGSAALTTYIYPNDQSTGISAFALNGNAVIKNLKIWDMH